MRLIIAGCRNATVPLPLLSSTLVSLNWDVSEVVSGGARGVDACGEAWAEAQGLPVRRFPADWKAHGRAAGPKRNGEMADYADALLAVWDFQSPGTRDMIRKAQARGLKVFVLPL